MTETCELPQGAEKVKAVDKMFDAIAPRYDLLNRVLTFGMDVGWRRRTVKSLQLSPGAKVLDLACGTGDLCRMLAKRGYRPVGVDRSAGMLAAQRTTAPLIRGDALVLPFRSNSVDGVVCGFALRNFSSLKPFLKECSRVIRPGGRVALLEVAEPENSVLRWGHSQYFGKVVPLVGGLLSDRDAYQYLPKSVAYLPPPTRMVSMMAECRLRQRQPQAPVDGHRPAAHRDQAVTSTTTGLRSHTWVLDAGLDPLAALGPGGFAWFAEGFGLATSGVAARVSVADAAEVLAGIAGDDPLAEPGTGPLAVGALGWDGRGELVIPARIAGRTADGRSWVTEVGPADDDAEGWPATRLAPPGRRDRAAWTAAVEEALARIGDGRLAKVVLAREVTVELHRPLDVATVVGRLRRQQPACFTYAAGGYVGASPELLARRRGHDLVSRPMAGTVAQGGSAVDDRRLVAAMAASAKEQAEHRLVVDDVRAKLRSIGAHSPEARGPEVVRLSTVAHLATTVGLPPAGPRALGPRRRRPAPPHAGGRRRARGGGDGRHRRARRLRPRPLRRPRRLGRRPRRRRLGRGPARRHPRRHPGPAGGRRRHRGRLRPRRRVGRDRGQAGRHALRPHRRLSLGHGRQRPAHAFGGEGVLQPLSGARAHAPAGQRQQHAGVLRSVAGEGQRREAVGDLVQQDQLAAGPLRHLQHSVDRIRRRPAVPVAGPHLEGPRTPAGHEPVGRRQPVHPRLHALDRGQPPAGVDQALGPVEAGPLAVARTGRRHPPKSLTTRRNGSGLTARSPEKGWLRTRITRICRASTVANAPTMR